MMMMPVDALPEVSIQSRKGGDSSSYIAFSELRIRLINAC